MPLVRCVRRCWDSQATKRYWQGDVSDLPLDHPLVKAKCFEIVKAEDLVRDQNEANTQLRKAFEMIAELTKEITILKSGEAKREISKSK